MTFIQTYLNWNKKPDTLGSLNKKVKEDVMGLLPKKLIFSGLRLKEDFKYKYSDNLQEIEITNKLISEIKKKLEQYFERGK